MEFRSWQSEREVQVRSALLGLATELAKLEASSSNLKLSIDAGRMGCLAFARTGPMGFQEVWEDGQAFRDLSRQRLAVAAAREEVEAARKALKKRLPPPPRGAGLAAANSSSGGGDGAGVGGAKGAGSGSGNGTNAEGYLPALEYVAQDEILKARLGALKREEEMLAKEEERLQLEKRRYIR
jgi:tousled-like kinase